MRLTRCYIPEPINVGTQQRLPSQVCAHLVRVLRLRIGEHCLVFNGNGKDYVAKLMEADKRGALIQIIEEKPVESESPLHITLVQGIARGPKMDFILQKATELGVQTIIPITTQRSDVQLSDTRLVKRLSHWQGVITSACEQCGRARLPTLSMTATLASLDALLPSKAIRLLLDPSAHHRPAALPQPPALVLAVGPEGGWETQEQLQLMAIGFTAFRLGPRILRTETAGLSAIAVFQSLFGDL